MCVLVQNGNSDSKISYPVATKKFRRKDRWGCCCSAPWLTAGVESVTVDDFIVLPAVTNYPPRAGEVAQWVLTKKGECPSVYSQALT